MDDDAGGEPPLVVGDLDCGNRDLTGALQVSGAITQDTTWSGIVHVTATTSLRNEAILTILPGTKVFVAAGAQIEIGWEGSSPTLLAAGTPLAPIRICGVEGRAGYWSGLVIQPNVSPASVVRNVLVAEGGGAAAGAALVLNAPIVLQGVQVLDSGTSGVASAVFAPESRSLRVKGSAGAPLEVTAAGGFGVPPGTLFADNGSAFIAVTLPRIAGSATVKDWGIPYRQTMDVAGATPADGVVTVSIEPGVVYEISDSRTLDLGSATLLAVGTEGAPIVFRPGPCVFLCFPGVSARAGQVRIGAASTGSRMEHVTLEGGGRATGSSSNITRHGALAIAATAPVALIDVTIMDAHPVGLELTGQSSGLTDDSARIHVDMDANIGGSAVSTSVLLDSAACTEVSSVRSGLFTFGDLALVEIGCRPSGAPVTFRNIGHPYSFRGGPLNDWSISGPVTVEPGTIFEIRDAEIGVFSGAMLTAHGTASAPIEFRQWVSEWDGFDIRSGSVDFDHVRVSVSQTGANGNTAAIRTEVPFQLRNSTVEGARGYGILKRASDPTDYLPTNTFLDNYFGAVGTIP